jgi:hypothetical protein
MASVHRYSDPNSAGGLVTDTVQQRSVYVNDLLMSVDGSCVTGHSPFEPPHAPTCVPKTANGAINVTAEDIPMNYDGCADTCGHIRATGSPNVFFG